MASWPWTTNNVIAAALLDRLLHHAIVIEINGSSYRLREHAYVMPEALHPTPMSTPPKRRRGRPRKTGGIPVTDRLTTDPIATSGWGILHQQKWGDLFRY